LQQKQSRSVHGGYDLTVGFKSGDAMKIDIVNLRHFYPAARIILFGEEADFDKIIPFINLGVYGYVSKPDNLSELKVCIDAVRSGKMYIALTSPSLPDVNELIVDVSPIMGRLSKREKEIAGCLVLGMTTSKLEVGSAKSRQLLARSNGIFLTSLASTI
jgi:hypothetical protein